MVFKAKDETEGWQMAGNGRLKSSADWRELNNEYGPIINVRLEAYTDDESYSGYLFYNLYNEQVISKGSKGKQKQLRDNPFNEDFDLEIPNVQRSYQITNPTIQQANTSVGYGFIDMNQASINIPDPRR